MDSQDGRARPEGPEILLQGENRGREPDTASNTGDQAAAAGSRPRPDLTRNQRLALAYLADGRMEATSRAIGEELRRHGHPSRSPSSAATVMRWLQKWGLATFLPDLLAWRITERGRERWQSSRG